MGLDLRRPAARASWRAIARAVLLALLLAANACGRDDAGAPPGKLAAGGTASAGDVTVRIDILRDPWSSKSFSMYRPALGRHFVAIKVRVENTGDLTRLVTPSQFTLYDDEGFQYEAKMLGSIPDGWLGMASLNGRAKTDGWVGFEVHDRAQLAKLQWDPGAFSGEPVQFVAAGR